MDFKIKRRSVNTHPKGTVISLYPHDLQMYKIPPVEKISLQEYELLAIERLKLLRILASATTLKGYRLFSEQWNDFVFSELKTEGLKYYIKLCEKSGCSSTEPEIQARRKDHIAHFILRLAYCRTEELRRWFIAREMELFKMRFLAMRNDAVDSFFTINNLCYTNISPEEKNSIINYLRESTHHQQVDTLRFYKVKFFEVLDLVKTRRVYINSGYAYIPHVDFISVLLAQFRKHLKQSLAIAAHHLGEIEQDERLVSLLKGLHHSYTGDDYSSTNTVISIENLDAYSVKSFPMCMRQLHEYLRSAHHLKHSGRLQYGLFLKGIGVTLEDSLRFWREEFTKIMDIDKFEKSYAYGIRYNYGKEGSKRNYSPYSCMKIIESSVGPGECHGCPFKHCDVNTLKNKLQGYALDPQAIQNITEMAKKGHYQIACSKYFDAVHNVDVGLGINHPNQYFEESQKCDIKPHSQNGTIDKNKSENLPDLEEMELDMK